MTKGKKERKIEKEGRQIKKIPTARAWNGNEWKERLRNSILKKKNSN